MRARPSLRVASLFAHKNPFDLPPSASWTRLNRFEDPCVYGGASFLFRMHNYPSCRIFLCYPLNIWTSARNCVPRANLAYIYFLLSVYPSSMLFNRKNLLQIYIYIYFFPFLILSRRNKSSGRIVLFTFLIVHAAENSCLVFFFYILWANPFG